MSRTIDDKIRLIRITAGNLLNNQISIGGQYDFFPCDCFGASRKSANGLGKSIQIVLEGLDMIVETDIGTEARSGQPRRMFRGRTWVRQYFQHHGIRIGDVLALERIGARLYRLYPFDSTNRDLNGISGSSAREGSLPESREPSSRISAAKGKKNQSSPSCIPGAVSRDPATNSSPSRLYHQTKLGVIYLGDALRTMEEKVNDRSVDLIVTSPPFGLVRKKDYGNVDANAYLEWFRPFGEAFRRVLKPSGSLVIDIGGAWIPGQPTRSLYHYELLIMLCREVGFHLAQDFFWWNPAKLPSPAEWVTVRRIRVKDAFNCVWWLSPTPCARMAA